ncbi:hypothetical protein A5662_12610 [Mycobacteriaceae bacterium 1482268.1]|nr:hypothetical protein A5662_12610 [Mycobacteriaceae bacterium 1482268.1]
MGSLKVEPADLQMVATTCDDWAVELRSVHAPSLSGDSYQSSSAAVGLLHEGIAAARDVLARRMQHTAEKLHAASADYAKTEERSAAIIGELPTAL